MPRRNEVVARLLENIAKLLELTGDDHFRIRAYSEAARTIDAMTEDIAEVYLAGRLEDIPGVGASISAKISEYLATGKCDYYEGLKRQVLVAAVDLLEIPGIGPARAKLLFERLGISSVTDLERAAHQHQLRELPGFGAQLEDRLAREAARVAERSRRLLLGVALPAAEEMAAELRHHPAVRAIEPAGSIRRWRETIGDIDLLAASGRPAEVMDAFVHQPAVKEVLSQGPTRASILTQSDLHTPAPTAEALMRSRYTAYVLELEEYLLQTWHPDTRPTALNLHEDQSIKWLGLQVKEAHTNGTQVGGSHATVTFVARYKVGGKAERLVEVSEFVFEDERWYYLSGQHPEN